MNIGLFTDTYLPSINGIVTSIETFRKEIEGLGHKVFIFCPKGRKIIKQFDSCREDKIFRYFSMPYPLLREYRLVVPFPMKLKTIKKLNLDIIHFHTPFLMGFFACYISKRLKIPLIQTYHTYLTEYVHYVPLPKKIIIPFAIWASKVYCDSSVFVISPSRLIKDVLLSYGVKSEIIIIPTGINKINDTSFSKAEIKQKYKIPKGKIILISVGRLGKEKNTAFLIRAFKLIQQEYTNTNLVLIGDGPEKQRLSHLSNRLGLKQNVKFLGSIVRNEVLKIIAASDIFVFASRTETQGLCLLEAMASGKPVVAIDSMGVTDIMKGDKGGFLVKANETVFAKKVISLLQNRSLCARKKEEALTIAENYSSHNLAKLMISYYEKALQRKQTNVPVF